jgi:AraC-like DNA-binding protein
MVCNRCIRVVREELEGLGVRVLSVVLGEVTTEGPITSLPVPEIRKVLQQNGFELIEDRRTRIIEQIKHEVIAMVFGSAGVSAKGKKISEVLSEKTGIEYHSLSTLFSSVENMTVEHYFLLQRIERVKELVKYNEQTLSEIAYATGFSSVQHLSAQFRQLTGMTPSQFKDLTHSLRRPLDAIGKK